MDKPTVIFTFDDGWIDGFTWQMWCGKPATFFVIPQFYEYPYLNLDIPQNKLQEYDPILKMACIPYKSLGRLLNSGCEIGSHSYLHCRYDKIDVDEAVDDLRASMKVLSGLGRNSPITSFAYPDHKEGHRDLVHKYFPYIRPFFAHENPIIYPGDVRLYVWHRAHECGTGGVDGIPINMMCLYCVTEKLKEQDARFITFRQACEEELINDY